MAATRLSMGRCLRSARHVRRAFTLVELLVVIGIIGTLVGLLLPAVLSARSASRRLVCVNHLKQIGLAMHNYHAGQGQFPTGSPLHRLKTRASPAWTVFLLPYLEHQALYDQMQPTSEGGVKSFEPGNTVIETYLCPSDNTDALEPMRARCNYAGVSGAGRYEAYVDLDDTICGDVDTDGVLFPQSAVRIKDITDGASHTLAVGERVYFASDWSRGVIWGERAVDEWCAYATKNVRCPINGDLDTCGRFPRDLGYETGMKIMMRNDLIFGSLHAGGAHFVLADGSVHFLSESIDFTLYQGLATRNGEEISPWP